MTTATIYAEIEIDLSGTYVPYLRATHVDPADGGFAEDVAIDGLFFETTFGGKKRHDLLEGVDTASKDVQRFLANLLALHEEEAQEAIVEAESE